MLLITIKCFLNTKSSQKFKRKFHNMQSNAYLFNTILLYYLFNTILHAINFWLYNIYSILYIFISCIILFLLMLPNSTPASIILGTTFSIFGYTTTGNSSFLKIQRLWRTQQANMTCGIFFISVKGKQSNKIRNRTFNNPKARSIAILVEDKQKL